MSPDNTNENTDTAEHGRQERPCAKPVLLTATILIVIGLLIGGTLWYFTQQPAEKDPDPFAGCAGTVDVIDGYLYGLNAAVADIPASEVFNDNDATVGFMAVYQAYNLSSCDPDDITDAIDWDSMNDTTKTVMWSLLADLAVRRDDFDNPPAESQALQSAIPDDTGKPVEVAPEGLREGELIIVFADAPCDGCYESFESELQDTYPDMPVYVVEENYTSRSLADMYGWKLLDPAEVPITNVMAERPAAAIIRDGVALTWVTGKGAFADASGDLSILSNPLDRSKEPVHAQYLKWYGSCDGYRAAGAVVNSTDRPIDAVVVTDPNVKFDAEGLPLSSVTYHDLGAVAPWSYVTFDVMTGADAYAPCWLQMGAYYTDGQDLRGADWSPGQPPTEFIEDPQTVAELEEVDLPHQIIATHDLPTIDDVIALEDGPPPGPNAGSGGDTSTTAPPQGP